jgi:hypothetical protein
MIRFLYRYFYMRANFSVDCFITDVGGKVEKLAILYVKRWESSGNENRVGNSKGLSLGAPHQILHHYSP